MSVVHASAGQFSGELGYGGPPAQAERPDAGAGQRRPVRLAADRQLRHQILLGQRS